MPRPANLIKANYVGTLPQGEIFQTGFWIDATGTPINQAYLNGLVSDMAASFTAASNGIRALTNVSTFYNEIRLYHYPDPGPAPAEEIAVATLNLPGLNGAPGTLPLQCALVATLRTALVGRSYRGRMYFPATALTLADHQASQVAINGLVADVDTMLENVNSYDTGALQAVVMSATRSSTAEVTQVTVDSRLDIQRRRAESQTELRQAAAAVTP